MSEIICAATLEENKIYQGKKQKLLLMWEFFNLQKFTLVKLIGYILF